MGVTVYGYGYYDLFGNRSSKNASCSPSEYSKKRWLETTHISLFSEEDELISIIVSILGDGLTNLNLSLLTAKAISGQIEVKSQVCACAKDAYIGLLNGFHDAIYEWQDEFVSGKQDVTGSGAWIGSTYLAATAEITFFPDATVIANKIKANRYCE